MTKVGEEQLFYLMSRGLTEAEAMAMIVRGFIEPIAKELPLEYAVELNRLIELEMEGGRGLSAPARPRNCGSRHANLGPSPVLTARGESCASAAAALADGRDARDGRRPRAAAVAPPRWTAAGLHDGVPAPTGLGEHRRRGHWPNSGQALVDQTTWAAAPVAAL